MSEDLIHKLLAQMSPEQEALALLRDIKALLQPLHDAEMRRVADDLEARTIAAEPLEDFIHNISPTKTPFLEAGAGALMRVTKSPEPKSNNKGRNK